MFSVRQEIMFKCYLSEYNCLRGLFVERIREIRTHFTGLRSTYTFPLTFLLQNESISFLFRHRDVIRSVPKGTYSVVVGRHEAILLKWIFKKWDEEAWSGLILLKIETCGVSLRVQ